MNFEEFVSRCNKVHGNKYSYIEDSFKGSSKKVRIICHTHGEFEQFPYNHLRGYGCKKCKNRGALTLKNRTESFKNKAAALYGDRFDFSLVDYKDAHTYVAVICKKHGIFYQTPNCILTNRNCQQCSKEVVLSKRALKSMNNFKEKSTMLHNNKYDYSLVDFKNYRIPVEIICPLHGIFKMPPDSHLAGSNCPSCVSSGFSKDLPSYLYVFSTGDIIKIGITNTSVEERLRRIKNSSGMLFETVFIKFYESGSIAYDIEQNCLKYFKTLYKQPSDKFHGYSECFYTQDIAFILNTLKNYDTRLNAK